MTRYESNLTGAHILEKFYKSQPETYGLLSSSDDYICWLASEIAGRVPDDGVIVEIGCNDGFLLNKLKNDHHRHVIGFEPSVKFHDIWDRRDLNVVNDFFSKETALRIKGQLCSAVIVRHVLEHIEDPVSFIDLISEFVDEQTLVVIESPYLPTVISRNRFENIGFAHLNHFTSRALSAMLAQRGMGIVEFSRVNTDGGSFLAYIRKGVRTSSQYKDFVTSEDLSDFVGRLWENGKRLRSAMSIFEKSEIVGYGAGAKGHFLLSLYELQDNICAVVDDNSAFNGLYLAGGTPITTPLILQDRDIKAVILLAPTHLEKIKKSIPARLKTISVI